MIDEDDYYVIDLRLIQEIHEIINQIPIARQVKTYKIRNNPLETLQESEFQRNYKFSRSTANFIIDMVKNQLAGDTRGGFIPPHIKVLTAIRTWTRGEKQDNAGDLNGMSQPAISLVCKQVALALVAHRAQWITMPQNEPEQTSVIEEFNSLCGFKQVIGVIDCTHIRIPKVSGKMGQHYINGKGYSSINIQVISNSNLEIMDIVAHWPGSTHDSKIFNKSRLKQRFEQSEFEGRLLGDSAYECTPYLFTPVLNPSSQKEEMYNWAHRRTHNTVEQLFRVWKQRFRCLLRGFTTKLENSKLYTVALAVLHNVAMRRQEHLLADIEEQVDGNVPVTHITSNSHSGNAARAAFINQYF